MKKMYHYLFYKLYKYMLYTPNKVNAVEGAVALLSIITLLYLVSLTMLCKVIYDFGLVSKDKTMFIGLSIAFLVYYLNLKYFKNNLECIIKEFNNESKQQKILGGIIVTIIGIGSLSSIIVIGILLK